MFEYFGAVDERDKVRYGYPIDFFDQQSKIDPTYIANYATQLKLMLTQSSREVQEAVIKDLAGLLGDANLRNIN